jgi:hypothetical protein
MDLEPLRHAATGFEGSMPASLDYGVLVATLEALQAGTPTARTEGARVAPEPATAPAQPLVEIILGTPAWRDAVAAQGGSFNPARAVLLAGACKPK